jgi:hypothetical protein
VKVYSLWRKITGIGAIGKKQSRYGPYDYPGFMISDPKSPSLVSPVHRKLGFKAVF